MLYKERANGYKNIHFGKDINVPTKKNTDKLEVYK